VVGLVEGAVAGDSPKVATTMVTGVSRNGQATAAAIQIARGLDERERGGECGWAGLV
jgi:hypothetical protein